MDREAQGFDRILDNYHYIQKDMWTWEDVIIGTYEHNDIESEGYTRFKTK